MLRRSFQKADIAIASGVFITKIPAVRTNLIFINYSLVTAIGALRQSFFSMLVVDGPELIFHKS